MFRLIRRVLGVMRYRRRWGALAASAARDADRAIARHDRQPRLRTTGTEPAPRRRLF
jgi:hypothetical protein